MQKGSRAGREEPVPAFQRPASVLALSEDLRSEAKEMIVLVALGVGWIFCGFLAVGLWCGNFPPRNRRDLGEAMIFGLGGPISALLGFLVSGFAENGLRWTIAKPEDWK